VPLRLISSFGLPVALTTGRLVITAIDLARHPIGPVLATILATALLTGGLAWAGVRRRFASRRGSPS
jgi:hypothetical protein